MQLIHTVKSIKKNNKKRVEAQWPGCSVIENVNFIGDSEYLAYSTNEVLGQKHSETVRYMGAGLSILITLPYYTIQIRNNLA